MKGDLGSEGEETIDGGILPPRSCIIGNDNPVSDVVRVLIRFYFPKAHVIYDPTCGDENYQFSSWIYQKAYQKRYVYIASDIKRSKFTQFLADVFHIPLRDESVDVIVYDPPYVPYSREDDRGEKYDISYTRSPLKVKSFYSEKVMYELWRVTRIGIIIKCADFYYPQNTDNFYAIIPLIWQDVTKYFRVVAIHVYRYFYRTSLLYQHRLRYIVKRYRRPVMVHTYYVIAYKKDRK